MLNWELEPFSCNNNFLVAAIEGKSWQWNFAVVIVLILPSLRKCSFEEIISPNWILVDILSISQHVASNLWLAWPRYWLSQGAGARITANATTAKPKLNNHGVKIQFWSLGDYNCLVLVPCKLLLRLPLQFQPLHLNNCCNEALMNEFDKKTKFFKKLPIENLIHDLAKRYRNSYHIGINACSLELSSVNVGK